MRPILGFLRGTFYCRPVFLNTANRYQKWWYVLKKALRRERACPASEGKASRQRFSYPSVIPHSGGKYAALFRLPAAALLRVTDKP
jgi:hypothetical protein